MKTIEQLKAELEKVELIAVTEENKNIVDMLLEESDKYEVVRTETKAGQKAKVLDSFSIVEAAKYDLSNFDASEWHVDAIIFSDMQDVEAAIAEAKEEAVNDYLDWLLEEVKPMAKETNFDKSFILSCDGLGTFIQDKKCFAFDDLDASYNVCITKR